VHILVSYTFLHVTAVMSDIVQTNLYRLINKSQKRRYTVFGNFMQIHNMVELTCACSSGVQAKKTSRAPP